MKFDKFDKIAIKDDIKICFTDKEKKWGWARKEEVICFPFQDFRGILRICRGCTGKNGCDFEKEEKKYETETQALPKKGDVGFAIPLLKCFQVLMEQKLFGKNYYLENRVSVYGDTIQFSKFSIIESAEKNYSIYPFSYRDTSDVKAKARSSVRIIDFLKRENSEKIAYALEESEKELAKKYKNPKNLGNYDVVNLIPLDRVRIKNKRNEADKEEEKMFLNCCLSWVEFREFEYKNGYKIYYEHILRLPEPYVKEDTAGMAKKNPQLDIVVGGEPNDKQKKEQKSYSTKMIKTISGLEEICINPNYNSILIFGKPGAGKEIVKEAIFYGSAFYPILKNISLVNQEAEVVNKFLYGYVDQFGRYQEGLISQTLKEGKGKAFLFIDEIDKVSNDVRGSLLRLLQNKKYYVPNSIREERADGLRYIFAGSFPKLLSQDDDESKYKKKPIDFLKALKDHARVEKDEKNTLGPPDFWTRIDKAVLVEIPDEKEFYETLFRKDWDECVEKFLEAHFGTPGPFMEDFKKHEKHLKGQLELEVVNICPLKMGKGIEISYKIKWEISQGQEVKNNEPLEHIFSKESIREFKNKIREEVGKCFQAITRKPLSKK